MADLTKAQVASMLSMLGYEVPEPDLAEVVHRINALADSLKALDVLDIYHVEPRPVPPLGSPDRGR